MFQSVHKKRCIYNIVEALLGVGRARVGAVQSGFQCPCREKRRSALPSLPGTDGTQSFFNIWNAIVHITFVHIDIPIKSI